jgi:hypothetical protein
MKIDLPIVVIFDCQDTNWSAIERSAGKIVCTLRYDTEDVSGPVKLFQGYPPVDEKLWEPGDHLIAFMPTGIEKKIRSRAAASPYDYLDATFSEEERQAAQDKVDEHREPTP